MPSANDAAAAPRWRRTGFGRLVAQYGVPLAVYYFIFNESCIVFVTFLLHKDYVSGTAVLEVINRFGAGGRLNLGELMSMTLTLGPLELSARLVANFALASVFMSLWTPLQIPFCIATLPYAKRLGNAVRFWRKPTTSAAGA